MTRIVRKGLLLTAVSLLFAATEALACTSAIVSGRLTDSGRPMLWKHRDASDLNNKVERVTEVGKLSFVALFNSTDPKCEQAWIGMNEAGFAIMNTASYNLKADTVREMDHEGYLMYRALGQCRTLGDFERLLDSLPKPLRVEANFGVIDAYGGAAYFETDNWSFRRFDVDDTAEGYIVRTNYSHSGQKDGGYGYVREQNALTLLDPYVKSHTVSPEVFTEELSRSFYHSVVGRDFEKGADAWTMDIDFIPRYDSSASVVIEGVRSPEEVGGMVMWTVLGYPPCGTVVPVTLDNVPAEVRASTGGNSLAVLEANELKREVFPRTFDRGYRYIYLRALFNEEGTGISQRLERKNRELYKKYRNK